MFGGRLTGCESPGIQWSMRRQGREVEVELQKVEEGRAEPVAEPADFE